MTEEEINEVDGAIWGLSKNNEELFEVDTTIYKFTDKHTPKNEEIGSYRYHILTFKHTLEIDTIEFTKAYIGDVRHFIDNHAKAGYNGLMVKEGCIPKKTIKDLIKLTFKNWKLPEKALKPILLQV